MASRGHSFIVPFCPRKCSNKVLNASLISINTFPATAQLLCNVIMWTVYLWFTWLVYELMDKAEQRRSRLHELKCKSYDPGLDEVYHSSM